MATGALGPSVGVVISCVETNGSSSTRSPRRREDGAPNREAARSSLKQFKIRNSLLTELYEIKHIKTVYNVFAASFILLFINIAVNDIVEHKTLRLNIDLILWHFHGTDTVVITWLLMFGATVALYGSFKLWAYIREKVQESKNMRHSLDLLCGCAYALYLFFFLCGPPVGLLLRDALAPVTGSILIIEQLRMMMKSHAFVRSNLRMLPGRKGGRRTADGPDLKHFLYFHFAPTLVYRDSYPRTDSVRWKIVSWHACEVVGIAFYTAIIFEQFLHAHLTSFWDEPLSPSRALTLFFRSLFPGLLLLLLGFYVYFHAWMNAFAELLRFGDRLFYEDWWNTTTFAAYYRSWNLIVHDWMYEYLYLDIVKRFSKAAKDDPPSGGVRCRRNHFACKALVFLVSAAFHEYVVAIGLGFLYPVLFGLFGVVGVALMYVPIKKGAIGNIFLWLALSVGVAMILTAYCVEFYARRNCVAAKDIILDLVIPRTWTCNATKQQ